MKDRKLTDFDVSDYAAFYLQGWRVRWGAEGTDMVLLVDMNTPPDASNWALCQITPGSNAKIIYQDDRFQVVGPAGSVRTTFKKICQSEIESVPILLRRCFEDHYAGTPAPRHKNENWILSPEAACQVESQFRKHLEQKYLRDRKVYAVSESGTRLADSLGIRYDTLIANHYQSNTFQDDSAVKVSLEHNPQVGEKILVIDDMISSGRTTKAIIDKFRSIGCFDVKVAVIYNIQASREVFDYDDYVDWQMRISNFYWIYGRGMDLISPETRFMNAVYGADKSFIERQEDVDALRDYFDN